MEQKQRQQHRLLSLLSHANLSYCILVYDRRYAVIYKLIQMLNKPAAIEQRERGVPLIVSIALVIICRRGKLLLGSL